MPREITIYLFRAEKGLDQEAIDHVLDTIGSPGPVVLVDRDSVFGPLHLSSAVMQAARSIVGGGGRARDPSIEVLRWISGTHQVSRAIESAGAGRETRYLLALCLPNEWPNEDDPHTLLPTKLLPWMNEFPECLSDPDDQPAFGGRGALRRLGIPDDGTFNDLEAEKLLLESLCSPSLK
jgi:hypothetical protein